MQTLSESWWRI